jgi:hypothetical protein
LHIERMAHWRFGFPLHRPLTRRVQAENSTFRLINCGGDLFALCSSSYS